MIAADIYLTREGYEKLKKEFDYLKTVRRKELSEEIARARLHGDIAENAEYAAAKESLALSEKRMRELEDKLSRGRILENENISSDEALIGATVKLKDLGSGEELKYTLVAEIEANYAQGKISIGSPVGKSLLGRKKDETVQVKIPAGILTYKILEISRQ